MFIHSFISFAIARPFVGRRHSTIHKLLIFIVHVHWTQNDAELMEFGRNDSVCVCHNDVDALNFIPLCFFVLIKRKHTHQIEMYTQKTKGKLRCCRFDFCYYLLLANTNFNEIGSVECVSSVLTLSCTPNFLLSSSFDWFQSLFFHLCVEMYTFRYLCWNSDTKFWTFSQHRNIW